MTRSSPRARISASPSGRASCRLQPLTQLSRLRRATSIGARTNLPSRTGFPLEYQPRKNTADPERYRSGHNGADSKSDGRVKPARGFESHPLRHLNRRRTPASRGAPAGELPGCLREPRSVYGLRRPATANLASALLQCVAVCGRECLDEGMGQVIGGHFDEVAIEGDEQLPVLRPVGGARL